MVKSVPSEPVRRRTFFRSTISIQPRQDSPANSANQASSTTVLAALSPPKESTPNTRQPKNDNAASGSTSKTDETMHTAKAGESSRSALGAGKKSSGRLNDSKSQAIGPPKILPRIVKSQANQPSNSAPQTTTTTTTTVTRKSLIVQPKLAAKATSSSAAKEQNQVTVTSGSTSTGEGSAIEPRAKKTRLSHVVENGKANASSSSLSAAPPSSSAEEDDPPATSRSYWKQASRSDPKNNSVPEKQYMESGYYCQDDYAKSPLKLVSKVLLRREAELELNKKAVKARKGKSNANGGPPEVPPHVRLDLNRPVFPPLPYDYGHKLFFDEEHDFVLPFDIRSQAENGLLDGKKKPAAYSKLRANVFPERHRTKAPFAAICGCSPDSGCSEDCINEKMHYLCGKDCPCGDSCTNLSLAKRERPNVKLHYTGSRGFGLVAQEDIEEGRFVIDYRGEVISLESYHDRIKNEYAASRNFYALAYDQDEVIDAGARGNEARFINHSCNPNLIVQRFQSLGDGWEEYEVGMWASRDIAAGEELTYDYNFDAFGVSDGAKRVECKCGASNCVGYLGRKSGEKSSKQLALENEAKEAAKAKVAKIKAKRAAKQPSRPQDASGSGSRPTAGRTLSDSTAKARPAQQIASVSSNAKKGRASDSPSTLTGLTIGGMPLIAKIADSLAERPPRQRSGASSASASASPVKDSDEISIPPPVDFYRNETGSGSASRDAKGKGRQSLPAGQRAGSSSGQKSAKPDEREPSPVPLFVPHKKKRARESAPPVVSQSTPDIAPSSSTPTRSEQTDSAAASPKKPRPAGWAGWFKKKAGERPRTLEDWLRERETHKRGPGWLKDMMEEFGSLPGPGHPGQVGSVVSAELLEAKRKEALEAGIHIYPEESRRSKAAKKAAKKAAARKTDPGPGLGIALGSVAGPSGKHADKAADATQSEHDGDAEPRVVRETTQAREARIRAKAESIKKRNGAPMGWAYIPVAPDEAPPPRSVSAFRVHEDLPRSSRRRSSVSYHGAQ